MSEIYSTVPSIKTCYRCGQEFTTQAGRVCPECKKPKTWVGEPPTAVSLSFRERQIVGLVSQAMLNKEIAFELRLAEGTIKEYLNRIFRKLEVKNRTELALWGMRNLPNAA